MLVSLGLLTVYIIARLITKGAEHVFKRMRYEAGNPPRGRARRPLLKQYYGYILLFLVVEPLIVLLYLTSLATPTTMSAWILLATGLTTPILIYALHRIHEEGA